MWIQQAWVHNALAAHERWKGLLLCGKTKMMNECLEATFVVLPWLKFGEVVEVVVSVEDVLGTSVCSCL